MSNSDSEFQIKRLTTNDVFVFEELIKLFQVVFEMKNLQNIKPESLNELLAKPDFVAYAAIIGNKVIAGLTAYELQMYYGTYKELFIYDIAVDPAFQRVGIGQKLIASLKEYCKQNNIKEMFVEAHEEDKEAINFYNGSGGQAEKVVHFNFSTKQ